MKKVYNYSNDVACGNSGAFIDVISPLTGQAIAEVLISSKEDVNEVIQNAVIAQKAWGKETYKTRASYFYKYRELLIRDIEEIAELISLENGKAVHEARAEVSKAIELTEFACSIPSVINGNTQMVSKGIEVKEVRSPKGVIGCIMPFNFPLMVPHWTIPSAIVCGNAVVAKASESTPLTLQKVAELLKEAGIPAGIFNIINGDAIAVSELCSNEGIDVVTFVGSSRVAKIVYQKASEHLKPCLALGEAKNHIIVDNTVNFAAVAKELIDSAFGMSGQRCMAASVLIKVGEDNYIVDEIVKIASTMEEGIDLPPVATIAQKEMIKEYIQECRNNGSEILVDGIMIDEAKENANYLLKPTVILHNDKENMRETEIFGPFLEIIEVDTIEEAIEIQNASPYGNGASVYTASGYIASVVSDGLTAGMIGVNIGVPVPREPYGFGGHKNSRYGSGEITGPSSLSLFTETKKVTCKWNLDDRKDWMS